MLRKLYFSQGASGGTGGADGVAGGGASVGNDNGATHPLTPSQKGGQSNDLKMPSIGGEKLNSHEDNKVEDGKNPQVQLGDKNKAGEKAGEDTGTKAGTGAVDLAGLEKLLSDDSEIDVYLNGGELKDGRDFIKAGTQKSQQLGDERRAFEQEKANFAKVMDSKMAELNQMQNNMMQLMSSMQGGGFNPQSGLRGGGSQNNYFDDGQVDFSQMDPAVKNLFNGMSAQIRKLEDSLGLMNISTQDRESHNILKNKYGDSYDVQSVQSAVDGFKFSPMEINELVYKAMQFDKTDLNAIRREAFKSGQKALLDKYAAIDKQRKTFVSDPVVPKGSGGGGGNKKAANFKEATQNAIADLNSRGVKLYT